MIRKLAVIDQTKYSTLALRAVSYEHYVNISLSINLISETNGLQYRSKVFVHVKARFEFPMQIF